MSEGKEALKIARNLVRVGLVNSINPSSGTIDVLLPDKDNSVCPNIPLLSFEYHMPSIGDSVVCIFLGNGLEQGICVGKYFSDINTTPDTNEKVYVKRIDENMELKYNKDTKALDLRVEGVRIKIQGGTVEVLANEIHLGNGNKEGVPLGATLKDWLDNHTHPTIGSAPSTESPEPSEVVKIC